VSQSIGLTAVLELSSFSKAVASYNQAISGMSKNTASTASSISSQFSNAGSSILKFGAIAGGIALAGVAALTGGLVLLGSTALTEFSKYERMSLSIQSLVARDLVQGKQVEVQRQVLASLTKKEADELGGLAGKIQDEELARNTLKARIQEQSEALRQLRDAHGENALDVQTATARLAEMTDQYNDAGVEIDGMKNRLTELSSKNGELVTVLDKVRTGQMSMTDAMAQAGPKAKELLYWISKLAIQSPFTEEGINNAFQTALAYGFNVEKAKELTQAEVDYAAATGKSVETTNLIALALGQMQAKGKVSGQEIIQLTNAGIGVNRILENMGFNLDDVSNGLVDSDKFIQAVIDDMNIFKGAGAAQASTFSGLISTLSDLKAIGLREFFTGTFTAIQPYLVDFVGGLVSATLETGRIRQLGETIGGVVAQGLKQVADFVKIIVSGFRVLGGQKSSVQLFTALRELGFNTDLAKQITDITRGVRELFTTIQAGFQQVGSAFQSGGFLGAINEISSMISEAWTTTIQPALSVWSSNFFNWLLYDVIPAIPGQVTTLVNTISENLRTGWNFVASTLTGWGYNFFNWVTETVIPALPGQLNKIITAISDYLNSQFPTIGGAFDSAVTAIDEGLSKIQGAFTRFGAKGATISILGMLGMDPETIGKIDTTLTSISESISTFVSNVMLAYSRFGGEGAAFSILGQLGVSSDTLVTLKTTLDEIVANVTGFVTRIQEAFTSGSKEGGLFGGMLTSLETTAGEILADIPTTLTKITDAIAGHFRTNVPAFQEAMADWTPKFWEWVNTVVDGAAAALLGVTVAIAAWATSQEAQDSLNKTGSEVGKSIVKGIGLLFDNADEINKVMLKLAGKLLLGVAILTGSLLVVGGQIVAGITSGILAALGIDLKPATFNELGTILTNIGKDIVTIAKTLGTKIVNAINDGLIATLKSGMKLGDEIKKKVEDTRQVIDDFRQLGADAIDGLLEGMKERAGDVLEFLKNLAMDSLAGLGQFWGAHSPATKFMPLGASTMQGVIAGGQSMASEVAKSFTSLGQSAINSLMTGLTVTDPNFIHDLIDDLNIGGFKGASGGGQWRNFRNILINEITAGMSGLEAGTIDFMSKITDVANRFHFPPELAREFAQAEGLVEHLTGTFSVMFQKMRIENMAAAAGIASNFSGIAGAFAGMLQSQMDAFSKAREEAAKLGEANTKLTETLGTQEGKLASLQNELAELTTGEEADTVAIEKKTLAIEKANETLGFQERQLAILRQELAELTSQENVDTLAVEKKQLAIDKLIEGMDDQKKQLVILKEELVRLTEASELDTDAIERKQAAIAELTGEIGKNQEAIAKNEAALVAYHKELAKKVGTGFSSFATNSDKLEADMAMMELLQAFLDTGAEQMRINDQVMGGAFAGTGLTGLWTRVFAQEELNKLLAEQAQREEEITKQKEAQQNLDFLMQQINLIKLLSDRGLNPANILQGITLGLNAGVGDLLAATNRIVEAMVNQINADLQIHSPSGLMIKTFKQVMAGAAIGMERGQSLLSDAVRSIPILNGSIPQPVFSQAGGVGGSSSTYNYNFPMTVNTAATAPAVVRQYEIKRSMYAN